MKRLFYIALALVLIMTAGCKRKNRAERLYERYLNDSDRVEFITPKDDPVKIKEEVVKETVVDNGEGLFAIPDIPEERGVNMNSSDAELEDVMSGKDVDEVSKKSKKKSK